MLNWNLSRGDFELMDRIVSRAMRMAREHGQPDLPAIDILMDLTACHANGCPLQLAQLLEAPDSDFAHDVFGIMRHIDRETGKLGDCFSPRYSVRAGAQ